MVNVPEIKAYIAILSDMTNKKLAKRIGTSSATLARWFEKRDMPTSAAEKVMVTLEIPADEAMKIFFCSDVA